MLVVCHTVRYIVAMAGWLTAGVGARGLRYVPLYTVAAAYSVYKIIITIIIVYIGVEVHDSIENVARFVFNNDLCLYKKYRSNNSCLYVNEIFIPHQIHL